MKHAIDRCCIGRINGLAHITEIVMELEVYSMTIIYLWIMHCFLCPKYPAYPVLWCHLIVVINAKKKGYHNCNILCNTCEVKNNHCKLYPFNPPALLLFPLLHPQPEPLKMYSPLPFLETFTHKFMACRLITGKLLWWKVTHIWYIWFTKFFYRLTPRRMLTHCRCVWLGYTSSTMVAGWRYHSNMLNFALFKRR